MNGLFAETAQDPINQISETNLRDELQPRSASDSVFKGFTIDGSFLYWNAKVDGYAFADKVKLSGISEGVPTSIKGNLEVESPSFDTWDPGFQVGLGYIFAARQQWHTRLSWTRFDTSNSKSVKTDPEDLFIKHIFPTLSPYLTGPIADKASAKLDLNFNTLDWELGRQFFIGKWLAFNPKMGLRAAWINQDFKVKYHSYFPTNDTILSENTSFKANQDFKGIGLKIGSDVEFYITKSWSILGNLSTSILAGSIDTKSKIKGLLVIDVGPESFTIPETITIKDSANKLRSNLEGQLGIQWQTFFYDNKYRFGCSALYSFAYWFSQNNMRDELITFNPNLSQPLIQESVQNGDLQIQGLNIKFEFDF